MTIAYAVKQLRFTFKLGKGQFGNSGFNTLTLPDGMRATIHVENAVMPGTGFAVIRIYGMKLDTMNQLSKAGLVYAQAQNYVQVDAGDSVTGTATVYKGLIIEAYPDMKQPETSFYIYSTPTWKMQIEPVKPVSFSGAVTTETAMTQILAPTDFKLENNGVSAVFSSPYFPGDSWTQIRSCVRAANCYGYADGVSQTLAIWPKNKARTGAATLISPDTGLIDYPSFQQFTVKVRVGYDPRTVFKLGKTVQLKSGLTAADGRFTIQGGTLELSSQMPKGPWEYDLLLFPTPTETKSGNVDVTINSITP